MAKAKILIPGYVSLDTGGHSCSTVSLVQDKGLNIIVDPGTLPDPKILINALKKEGLKINDINIVYITHSHVDHYRFISLFPKAKVLDYFGWWIGDTFKDYKNKVTDDIKLVKTPGHSIDGTTLLVKTKEGLVVICGDVFWKENYPNNDPFAFDNKKLSTSRKKLLKIADYIIPGHGEMFKVKINQ